MAALRASCIATSLLGGGDRSSGRGRREAKGGSEVKYSENPYIKETLDYTPN